MRRTVVAIALLVATTGPATAGPSVDDRAPSPCPGTMPASAPPPGSAFAPRVTIARIEVRGNSITSERLIRRALPVVEGDCLYADNARLRAARYKVLALGYFRDVDLRFERGARRGEVVLVVAVVERGTLVLNRIFLGTSGTTPAWAGLDGGDRNVLGLGLGVSGAFVVAAAGEQPGARAQRAFALRLDDPSITGGPLGWHLALHHVRASEPYRVAGDPADSAAAGFAAFDLRRAGARGGLTFAVTPLSRLALDLRGEAVDAALPAAPTLERPDGTTVPIDLHLRDGRSRVATVALGFDRDSRPDPILPYAGDHLAVMAELGIEPLSSYGYAGLLARYERWWRVAERHVVSGHVAGGAVLGDAPRFDRLYVGDLDRMLSPRALGLVVSSTTPFDVLGTGSDEVAYGELGGVAEVQWAYRLFRAGRHIYGGDLYVGAGLWSLNQRAALQADGADALNLDILFDAGLRLDTELGIFELGLANALGRVPL